MCDATLVSVAVELPVTTPTTPLRVWNESSPTLPRSASATPVAIVACPQNGTSASGLK